MSPTTLLNTEAAAGGLRVPPAMLETLYDALFSERRLIDDLIVQMRRQRNAVAVDDIQTVDESTYATHRILATLGQARQRRRQLNVLLGGSEDCSLRELEEMLSGQIDHRLQDARARLKQAADTLTREVGMNRRLLREALARTQQHARTLSGATSLASTYASEGLPPAMSDSSRGVLVNRMV